MARILLAGLVLVAVPGALGISQPAVKPSKSTCSILPAVGASYCNTFFNSSTPLQQYCAATAWKRWQLSSCEPMRGLACLALPAMLLAPPGRGAPPARSMLS